MLDFFRNASKTWMVKLLFMVLVLSFVAWGVGDVVRGGLFGRGPAIEVGKVHVTAAEVNQEFKREVERLQPMFGGKLTSDDARRMGILDRTIDTIVTRTLVDEAAKRLGLSIADEAVLNRIAQSPSFHNERGQFDRELMRRSLAKAGLSELDFLKIERSNMIRGQLADALSGSLPAPADLVTPLVKWREERRVADHAVIRDDQMPAPAQPDSATIEQYYKDQAARFMAPELRALTVLLLRPTDVTAEVEITPAMVEEAYQARMAEFHTPERRQVSQVVMADQASADKALAAVKAGKDLAAAGAAGGAKVVDLGMVEKADLPDELADAAFRQASGSVGDIVKSPLGWHLILVSKVNPGHTRSFQEVRGLLESDLRREKAVAKLSELANLVEDDFGGNATLEEVAQRRKLKTLKFAAVDAQGRDAQGKPITGLPHPQRLLDVAFKTDQGTESPLTDLEQDGLFLVRVDQVTPPAPKPLSAIRAEVIAAWSAEQRHQAARQKAEALAEQTRKGGAFAELVQTVGAKSQTSKPFTREAVDQSGLPAAQVAEIFKAQPGQVVLSAVPGGWSLARLDKIIAFDPAQDGKLVDSLSRRLSQSLSGDIVDQYLAALNGEIGVKVDRSQLAREE